MSKGQVVAVASEAWHIEPPEGRPRIALGFFTLKALLLYPPSTIVMALQRRVDRYGVILMSGTVDLLGLPGR